MSIVWYGVPNEDWTYHMIFFIYFCLYLSVRHLCIISKYFKQEQDTSNRSIWGAHYDEGRITRMSDPNWVWSLLAQRSIQRYRQLEQETGKKKKENS